jgi:hypothetical protein
MGNDIPRTRRFWNIVDTLFAIKNTNRLDKVIVNVCCTCQLVRLLTPMTYLSTPASSSNTAGNE